MTHRQKELIEMLLKQAGYKEEGRMYVHHATKSAIGLKELFPDEGDDAVTALVVAMQGLINDVLSKPNDTRYATAIGKAKQAIELFKQRK